MHVCILLIVFCVCLFCFAIDLCVALCFCSHRRNLTKNKDMALVHEIQFTGAKAFHGNLCTNTAQALTDTQECRNTQDVRVEYEIIQGKNTHR